MAHLVGKEPTGARVGVSLPEQVYPVATDNPTG
jgi:hypothetical protein